MAPDRHAPAETLPASGPDVVPTPSPDDEFVLTPTANTCLGFDWRVISALVSERQTEPSPLQFEEILKDLRENGALFADPMEQQGLFSFPF
jgi:hypothetical protein